MMYWISFVFFIFLGIQDAFAFPGMIRHGYQQCTSCHLSPNGGGALTDYGRELSQEIVSYKSLQGEGAFAYGALAPLSVPKELTWGGDVRVLGSWVDTARYREQRLFLMQADLEVAWNSEKWAIAAAFGGMDGIFSPYDYSPRHYFMYRVTPELSLRAGKFRTAYGLNIPEHVAVTREKLGFYPGNDPYNIEVAWMDESWNVFLTGIVGRPEYREWEEHGAISIGDYPGSIESGFASRVSRYLMEKIELGVNYLYGSSKLRDRHLAGAFWIAGFSPRFYWLSEWDLERLSVGSPQSSWLTYQRLNYEWVQGVHTFLTFERSKKLLQRYGVGLQFFPRPHWEIQAATHLQNSGGGRWDPMMWAMVHFYP